MMDKLTVMQVESLSEEADRIRSNLEEATKAILEALEQETLESVVLSYVTATTPDEEGRSHMRVNGFMHGSHKAVMTTLVNQIQTYSKALEAGECQ